MPEVEEIDLMIESALLAGSPGEPTTEDPLIPIGGGEEEETPGGF